MTTIYRLLTGPDNSEFCHKVTKALDEGWQLHGSPSVSFDAKKSMMICAQAVIKQSDLTYEPGRKLADY